MVSIIIPLHNLGKNGDYCLNKCLDSIMAQTYTDFEVLLMENCSSDDTVDVANTYCSKDSRFKLHILDTAGVSNARNKGIEFAKGDFITFIDGDDFVSEDYLQSASLYFNSADIIFLPWSFYYMPAKNIKNILSFSENKIFPRPDIDDKKLTSFICAKIIKSSITKNHLSFSTDMVISEDTLFMTEAFFNADTIACIKDGMYFYTQNRKGQITKKAAYNLVANLFDVIEKYKNIYISHNVYEKNKDMINKMTVSFFTGENFSQTDISKLSLDDIKRFMTLHKDFILQINADNFECKKWQKVWFKRIQYFLLKDKAHYFLKFMRIYRNLLPKFIRKKLYI